MGTTTAFVQSAIDNELPILEEIIDLVEKQEKTYINKEIERRRTRLGAGSPDQIKKEVGREVSGKSQASLSDHLS
jgi:superkiller protein 3